jgi:ADP-ribose pyrophosphatase YjhB (NUDIX family)
MALLPETEEEFEAFLTEKIPSWTSEGVRSLQIKFKPPKCHLMNVASRHGFFLHHALHSGNYVLMILWMDARTGCRIPAFAHHYIGIGGIVLKQSDETTTSGVEIALIKEHRSDQPEKWKLPGGFMDPGEKIQEAAIREVREETGIDADFLGVMGIRETAKFKYGASDLYFGTILFNKSTSIAIEDVREVKQA